jgi:hypothetical protein
VGGRAKALTTALLLLLLAINGLNVVNSYVGRDFMTAIESRSMQAFIGMALLYVSVFAVSTVTSVIYRFAEERLGLLWRGWLTRRLVGGYLINRNYYWLREDSELSNPDQRIAEDVRTFTATTLSLALILSTGPSRSWPSRASCGRSARRSSAPPVGTRSSAPGLTLVFGSRFCSTTSRPTARRVCGRSWSTCARTRRRWRSDAARGGSARGCWAAWTTSSRTPSGSSR